jgi:lia operon protein LiaG
MKSRVVALVHDPAERIRHLLLVILWLATLALGVAGLLSMAPRLALAAGVASGAAERYTVTGERIAIYDLAGALEVVPGDGSDVVVEVRRGGRDANTLRVAQGIIDGRSTLRVLFPDKRIVYPNGHSTTNNIRVNADGTFGGRGHGLEVFARRQTISDRGAGAQAWADLTIRVPRGRTLEVRLGVGGISAQGIEGAVTLDTYSGAVRAQRIKGSLLVDTGSGAVEVQDIDGELLVDTGSGAVTLMRVRGPRLVIDTGSGGVSGNELTTRDLMVDTGSGHVALEAVRAPKIKVDTGSGGVTLGLLEDVDDVLVDTGSGGVTLRVPAMLGAEVDIDTGSGGIDSEVPLTLRSKEHGELHGTIGDGRGRILVDTGSGGVRLVRS